MGYTSYWYRPKSLDKKKWKDFTSELEMLVKNLPEFCITAGSDGSDTGHEGRIVICGWNDKIREYGREHSIVSYKGQTVAFNGEGDMGHEGFVVDRVQEVGGRTATRNSKEGLYFSFCKTQRKPYDTLVCLVLISMKRWFMNDIVVSSDGDKDDWQPAMDLYYKLTDVIINWDILTYDPNDKK